MKQKLESLYPLHQNNFTNKTSDYSQNIVYIHYPGVVNYFEFVPLCVTFFILFFYIYFSVWKIEIIKSKFGIAFAAVMTVLGSLCMSVGLCFFFGLTLSMQGKEIFPYLVILVGLENVLVLTKSVVSTPQHLDVKIRVAQGLSKEGWSITKNLLLEITILTIGLATFVPVIQEFCIFAITGLFSDFFLQMLFFSTILGIDVHRMEISAEKTHTNFRNSLYQTHGLYDKIPTPYTRGMNRSKSHPRLSSAHHTDIVASQSQTQEKKIPKRLRLVNIWARTRFFQRAFMVWMIVWISIIVYNSGVIEHIIDMDWTKLNPKVSQEMPNKSSENFKSTTNSKINLNQTSSVLYDMNLVDVNYVTQKIPLSDNYEVNRTNDLAKLKHPDYSPWLRLSSQHWPAIFEKYNLSLSGNYIAVLPNIRISHAVSPEQAVLLRNGNEKYVHTFQWQALAAALDPIDFNGKYFLILLQILLHLRNF